MGNRLARAACQKDPLIAARNRMPMHWQKIVTKQQMTHRARRWFVREESGHDAVRAALLFCNRVRAESSRSW
jgi:hypothetical protein